MRAQRIIETCIYTEDLDAAERFYEEVLGLERIVRDPVRHVFFRCGRSVLLIFNPEQTATDGRAPAHGSRGPGHVTFAMNDEEIPKWRNWLGQRGIEIEKEVRWSGGGFSLYFRDPAGNSVELATPRIWGLED